MENLPERDPELWSIAKKRIGFKWSLMSYIVVNSMLILIWYYTTTEVGSYYYFWPIWPMLGWGVGLTFQYMHAYHGNTLFNVEKEYEKINGYIKSIKIWIMKLP